LTGTRALAHEAAFERTVVRDSKKAALTFGKAQSSNAKLTNEFRKTDLQGKTG
jgi:hypothetical protein